MGNLVKVVKGRNLGKFENVGKYRKSRKSGKSGKCGKHGNHRKCGKCGKGRKVGIGERMEGWKGGGMESGRKNILLTVILTCPHCTYLLQRNAGT